MMPSPDPRNLSKNPLDLFEEMALAQDWSFERYDADEISFPLIGQAGRYTLDITWLPPLEALHIACAVHLPIAKERQMEGLKLTARINARLWAGHFELEADQQVLVFRHALLLNGGAQPSQAQAENLIALARENCEKFLPAFRLIADFGKTALEALECALFETIGTA